MTKRKSIYILLAAIAGIILLSFLLISNFLQRRPFADLKQEDVTSVDISFGTYPNYPMKEADQQKLVSLLQSVTTNGRSDAYKELSAKSYSETFILHLKTEKDIRVEPFNPYFIIDGNGYRSNSKETLQEMSSLYTSYIDVVKQRMHH